MLWLKKFFNFGIDSKKSVKKKFRKVMASLSLEDRFTKIYEINYWGSSESASGVGSTLSLTENLRKELPNLFNKFGIKRVFDGPCGDFHWMQLVVKETGIHYIGGDIVEAMIKQNQAKFGAENIQFKKVDLTKDAIPTADLMICRDCLFHLSFEDTKKILHNFTQSDIPYLLTTSYVNNNSFINKDIVTGHFREIDLFSAPYHFPKESLYQIEDWIPPEEPRHMHLWSKAQVTEALAKFNDSK